MDRINNLSSLQINRTGQKPVLKQSPASKPASSEIDAVDLRKRPLTELMDQNKLREFMHDLPKVDLHRHLEGAIEPETFLSIAQRKNLELPHIYPGETFTQGTTEDSARTTQNASHLANSPMPSATFTNRPKYSLDDLKPHLQVTKDDKTLLDFLSKFNTIGRAFTDREAIEEITYKAAQDCVKDNVNYAEFRFSPVYMAEQYGISEEDVMRGVLDGVKKAKKDFDFDTRLIMIAERQRGSGHARHVAKMAEKHMKDGVVGLDLANDEFNFPPGPYARVFQEAKEAGLKITVHAGEAGGADNVKTSIEDLKADRIGHGVRTFQDPEVEKMVKEKGVTLEMCPTSNVQTGATDSMANHPFKKYYDQGMNVTINTDDPGVSDIDLSNEYQQVVTKFGFSMEDVEKFIMNGIDSAFLPPNEKAGLKAKYHKGIKAAEEKYLLADQ